MQSLRCGLARTLVVCALALAVLASASASEAHHHEVAPLPSPGGMPASPSVRVLVFPGIATGGRPVAGALVRVTVSGLLPGLLGYCIGSGLVGSDGPAVFVFNAGYTEQVEPIAIDGLPVLGLGSCGLSGDSTGTADVYVPAPEVPGQHAIGILAWPWGITASDPFIVYAEGDAGTLPVDHYNDEVPAATFVCAPNLTFYDDPTGNPTCRFDICDWAGYPEAKGRPIEQRPDGTIRMGTEQTVPRPPGPFRLRPGKSTDAGSDYAKARQAADAENRRIQEAPGRPGVEIHELQPVKFGGSATGYSNKWALKRDQHKPLTTVFRSVQRQVEKLARPGDCNADSGGGSSDGVS